MEMLLAALIVLMIPGLLTYLVPERRETVEELASALLGRGSLAAAELEAAARALPCAVAPLHRRAAPEAALDGGNDRFPTHAPSVETAPDGGRLETHRAPRGAPGECRLREARRGAG